jgi:malic enzyme
MGIIAGIGNIYFVYQFLKKLVTPFNKTKAFELGIIDETGKILKRRRDLETSEEKDAYNLSDTLIWNVKKLMGKIPGGKSRIASYAAALWLIKEQQDGYKITEEELELQFFDQFEKMYNNDLEFDSATLKKFEDILYEDSPTTAMGGGNIAVRGIPLLKKPPKGLVMKRFGGIDVFAIDPTYFQKSRLGKKKYTRYSGYVGEDEAGEYIRAFARKYPKKPIIVMDSSTGCMQYLRHGS